MRTSMDEMPLRPGATTAFYLKGVRQKSLFLMLLSVAIIALGLYAVTQGAYELRIAQVLRVLFGGGGDAADVVVWNIRLPRIIAAVVCGWGLSLAGLSLQSLLRNPLASPSTLGISQGAAFGAAFSVVFLGAEVVSVTISQINDLNAQDLGTALRRTPGVNISRYNPLGSFGGATGGAVFIRGFGSSRPGAEIKTLVDGE
ncbi:MAG: iron chelate uptake ABC transporter family permease subunit, partial [Deltaproteobacteria bacterium]|nr:iron chelate uptake ABC transporter family permease subunit [Deltaproteobacteria bacterium]